MQLTSDNENNISFPKEDYDRCFQIEDDSFWFSHRNECISQALRRFPFEGSFLDIGGGNGVVSKRLEADGISPVVLEPGADGAANAKRRGLERVICSTLDKAELEPKTFGAAGLFDVIEHVEDDVALLRQAHRVLKDSGVVCVTVPAYSWLWSAEDISAGHFRRYTTASLRQSLEAANFDVRYSTYFFAPLTVPLFIFRSLHYRMTKRARREEAAAKDHVPRPAMKRALEKMLSFERRAIESGRSLPFGTSCLAVGIRRPS